MTPAELRTWRTERGLTQAALGALLGLAVQQRRCETVARYERGESPIPRVVELALVAIDSANKASMCRRR